MKIQIAKTIFLSFLSTMKGILNLAEFKFGKKSDDFKFFRKETFDCFYKELIKLFKHLETKKIIEKCTCSSNVRKGYSDCPYCGGSGYKNK